MKKILHIIENFNGQAIEAWLYSLAIEDFTTKKKFKWTFFSVIGLPGKFDNKILDIGGNIIYSKATLNNKINFLLELRNIIIKEKFDIIHSHHDVLSAFYFLATLNLPIEKRITHIHNTSFSLPTKNFIKKNLLFKPLYYLSLYLSNHIVYVSDNTLSAFLKNKQRKKNRDHIINCGINLNPIQTSYLSKDDFLKAINIPNNSKIILFVGRMINYKNPIFLLKIFINLISVKNNAYLLYVGNGPLEIEINKLVMKLNLIDKIKVLGWRDDVSQIMSLSDLLVCPTLEKPLEALGLVVVEAQSNGLPVLMSKSIPKEAIVIDELIQIISLDENINIWSNKILEMLDWKKINNDKCFEMVKNSPFNIKFCFKKINDLYEM